MVTAHEILPQSHRVTEAIRRGRPAEQAELQAVNQKIRTIRITRLGSDLLVHDLMPPLRGDTSNRNGPFVALFPCDSVSLWPILLRASS